MSIPRSWSFLIVGLICITLAVAGIAINPPTSWDLLEITVYIILVTLGVAGILRLIYQRGLPD